MLSQIFTLFYALTVDVIVQAVAGSVAVSLRTEKFYDLVGCTSFALLSWLTMPSHPTARQRALNNIVIAARLYLGIYLAQRVLRRGDRRFDRAKRNRNLFIFFWVGQAVWVFTTMLPIILANTTKESAPLGTRAFDWLGGIFTAAGFGMEILADLQKHRFQANPANTNKFIDTGLWKYSRHPNYFGEILGWLGLYMMALPALHGLWKLIALASPLFEFALLMYASGVPMVERHADKTWGADPKYLEYKRTTPVLVPMLHIPILERSTATA